MTQRTAVEQFAEKNLGWNFSVNLWDITFITLGLSLISRETVIPVLVSQLTDSKLAIGLVPALWSLGFYLPQLLTANLAERMEYKKPFVMLIGSVLERLPYLIIGLTVLTSAISAPTLALVVVLAGVGLASSGAGIATPAWLDMIAKVIPVQRRGIWAGLGHGLGALMGIVGAYFVARILVSYAFPNNYALLFFLAFSLVVISWVGLALNREPPSPLTKEALPLQRYLGQLPAVLGRDSNYRRYLISKSLVNLGAMSTGFFAVYGTEVFAIDGAGVGLLTGILIGTQAIANPLWGLLGDRGGHKIVLAMAGFAITLAPLSALAAAGMPLLMLTFVFLGTYLAAEQASSLNIILEFCAPEDRPTYIGLTNTLLAPMLILAPIFGGWLAGALGLRVMFNIAVAVAISGTLLLFFWVREPRHPTPGTRA